MAQNEQTNGLNNEQISALQAILNDETSSAKEMEEAYMMLSKAGKIDDSKTYLEKIKAKREMEKIQNQKEAKNVEDHYSEVSEILDSMNPLDEKDEHFNVFRFKMDAIVINDEDGNPLNENDRKDAVQFLIDSAKLSVKKDLLSAPDYLANRNGDKRKVAEDLLMAKLLDAQMQIVMGYDQILPATEQELSSPVGFNEFCSRVKNELPEAFEKFKNAEPKKPLYTDIKSLANYYSNAHYDNQGFIDKLSQYDLNEKAKEKLQAFQSSVSALDDKISKHAKFGKWYAQAKELGKALWKNKKTIAANALFGAAASAALVAGGWAGAVAYTGWVAYSKIHQPIYNEYKRQLSKGGEANYWDTVKETMQGLFTKQTDPHKKALKAKVWGGIAAAGLGGTIAGVGAALGVGVVGNGVAAASTKLSVSTVAATGNITGDTIRLKAYKKLLNSEDEELAKEAKAEVTSAKWAIGGSIVGLGISAIFNGGKLLDENASTIDAASQPGIKPETGAPTVKPEATDSISAQSDSTSVAASGANAGNTPPAGTGDVNAEDYELPKAYDAKTMQGISPKQFNTLFKHANEQFIGGNDALESAYSAAQRLTPEQLSALGMKSPAELVYKFSRLDFELGRRPDVDALMDKIDVAFKEGDLKSLDEHLKHALDKGWISSDVAETKDKAEILAALDRKVLYVGEYPVDPAHPELGNITNAKLKLEQLLNCQEIIQENGKVTPGDLAVMKALLKTVDENGQYRGIGWDKGMTHNVPNGGTGNDNCDEVNKPNYKPGGRLPSNVPASKVPENISGKDVEVKGTDTKRISIGIVPSGEIPQLKVPLAEIEMPEISPSISWGDGKEVETVVNVGRSSVNGHFFRENYLHTQIVNAQRFEGMINGQNAVRIEGQLPDGTRFVQVDMEDGNKLVGVQKPGEEMKTVKLGKGQEGVINAQADELLAVRDKFKGTSIATSDETTTVNGHNGKVKLPKGTLVHDQEGNTYVPGKKGTTYCVDADNKVAINGTHTEDADVVRDTRDITYNANGLPKPKDGETVSQTILRAKVAKSR